MRDNPLFRLAMRLLPLFLANLVVCGVATYKFIFDSLPLNIATMVLLVQLIITVIAGYIIIKRS